MTKFYLISQARLVRLTRQLSGLHQAKDLLLDPSYCLTSTQMKSNDFDTDSLVQPFYLINSPKLKLIENVVT